MSSSSLRVLPALGVGPVLLGQGWALKAPFQLRVTAHDTDHAARLRFPGIAGARVEAALQASF